MQSQNEYSYRPLDEAVLAAKIEPNTPASRIRRLVAALIDTLITMAISFPLTYLTIGAWISPARSTKPVTDFASLLDSMSLVSMDTLGITVGTLAGYLAIQSWFWYSRSQSLGKMALGIVIANHPDGQRTRFSTILLRRTLLLDLIGYIPLFGYIFSLVDVLFIFGPKRRCLHDRIAGTWVIRATSTN